MPGSTTHPSNRLSTPNGTHPPAAATARPKVCLTPNCGKQPITRGLCPRCYVKARKLIKLGETNVDELVAAGLLLSRRSGNPLTVALAAHRKAAAIEA